MSSPPKPGEVNEGSEDLPKKRATKKGISREPKKGKLEAKHVLQTKPSLQVPDAEMGGKVSRGKKSGSP